jgi:hypothetical protein
MPRTTMPEGGTAVALTEAEIDRVDAVVAPATGLPFLIVKAAAGADGAEAVLEDLTGAAEPGGESGDAAADGPDEAESADSAAGVADLGENSDQDGQDTGPDDPAPTDARIPGSPTWEAADAQAAGQAAVVLTGLRQAVCELADRESSEGAFGDDSAYSQAGDLHDAVSALDFVLGILAKYHFTESADAAPADGGNDAVAKSAATWARLLVPREGDVLTESQIRDIAADQVAKSLAARVAADTTSGPADAAPAMPAPGAGDYASVFKSALGDALKPVIAVQERVADTLAGIEERVATVEKARMPGGPLLRGAAGVSADGLWTVQRGQAPVPAVEADQAPEALRKALSGIKDSRVRDAAGQAVAMGLHPLLAEQP